MLPALLFEEADMFHGCKDVSRDFNPRCILYPTYLSIYGLIYQVPDFVAIALVLHSCYPALDPIKLSPPQVSRAKI